MKNPIKKIHHILPGELPLLVQKKVLAGPIDPHSHSFSELVIVNSGSAVHHAGNEEYPVTSGDVFVINPPLVHWYENRKDFAITDILFLPEIINTSKYDIGSLPGYHALFTLEPQYRGNQRFESRLRLTPEDLKKVNLLIIQIEKEITEKNAGYCCLAAAFFMQLLIFLSRSYEKELPNSGEEPLRLGKVLGHIEKNYRQAMTLNDLAEISHMSQSTLLRSFRKAVGMAPIEYLNIRKITASCEILRRGASITEAAVSAGFEDSNYFARLFRKIIGTSPSEYRKNNSIQKL